jgi:hypothetical protein
MIHRYRVSTPSLLEGQPWCPVEEVAVAGGSVVDRGRLVAGEIAKQANVEGHVLSADRATHASNDLRVDNRHPYRVFATGDHPAGDVEQPPTVLVAAVVLVEDLEEMSAGFDRVAIRCAARVPEGVSLNFEGADLVGDVGKAGANIPQCHRGPVGDVAFGDGSMAGDVPGDQLGACGVGLKSSSVRHAFGEQGVGVLAVAGRAAADQAMNLGQAGHERKGMPTEGEAFGREMVSEFGPSEIPARESGCDDRRGSFPDGVRDAFLFELSFPAS